MIPGEAGDPGFGDQLGDIPLTSDAPEGEKLGPPGVIPLTAQTIEKGKKKQISAHEISQSILRFLVTIFFALTSSWRPFSIPRSR